jgi:TolB-like protein/cytochrome c-type biogenesis protein CcmH/NrfG/predicted Ser/Thr protein kinase
MLGKNIAHYRIESELGRGGIGIVYRARDVRLERTVALKVLADQWQEHREYRQMILAEARAAAALNHPGVATVYEVGEYDGGLYIAMELISGKNLRQHMEDGAFEISKLLRLATRVAEALEAAHAGGVIHGDVKPENIVVLPNEHIKLLDFGIARRAADTALTNTQTTSTQDWLPDSRIAGTLAYMSPEQLRGEQTDGRADLYSLGVILFELAMGRRPFQARNAPELIAQILHDQPPGLEGALQELPREMAGIIFRLLEKDRARRHGSASEFLAELSDLQREWEHEKLLPAALAGKRSVAVLPFKLLTASAADEYLGVALADALIHALGASGELLVRPTTSVERYAKQPVDLLRVARELNVQTVSHGSIQKSGTRLRVHVQVWDADKSAPVFSAKHDGEVSELFTLQDELAAGVKHALGVRTTATPEKESAPPTENPRAYELYLRATERLARLNRWDTRTAIEMLEQAVALDPKFADGWAKLAEACALIGVTQEPHPRWLKRADQAIRRALGLDRHNAEVYCARGRVLWTPARGFKNRPALRALNEALHLNPGCHAAQIWRCLIFLHLGLLAKAKEGLLEALATHPDDAFTLVFIGHTALYRGDYAEAEEFQARALRIDPANLWGNGFWPTALLYANRLPKAEEKIRMARQVLQDDPWLVSCEALLWAKRGECRKADTLLRRSLRPVKTFLHTHHLWHNAAAAYALIDKPAAAVSLLRRASAFGLPNFPAFRDDPHFQVLQTNASFCTLLGKLQREWTGYEKEFGGS